MVILNDNKEESSNIPVWYLPYSILVQDFFYTLYYVQMSLDILLRTRLSIHENKNYTK